MNYWIVADICSDLPKTYVYAQERVTLMPMNYTMAGKEYSYRVGDENRSDEFYQKIRGGEKASTSLIGISEYFDVFKQITDGGEGGLCVPLSSGISGSFGSASSAREQILAQKPEAKVQVVDSLAASLGLAQRARRGGASSSILLHGDHRFDRRRPALLQGPLGP